MYGIFLVLIVFCFVYVFEGQNLFVMIFFVGGDFVFLYELNQNVIMSGIFLLDVNIIIYYCMRFV